MDNFGNDTKRRDLENIVAELTGYENIAIYIYREIRRAFAVTVQLPGITGHVDNFRDLAERRNFKNVVTGIARHDDVPGHRVHDRPQRKRQCLPQSIPRLVNDHIHW